MHILCASPPQDLPWESFGRPLAPGDPLGGASGGLGGSWGVSGALLGPSSDPCGSPGWPLGTLGRPWRDPWGSLGALGGCSGDHGEASGEPRGTLELPQASQECPGDSPGPLKTPLDAPEGVPGESRASPGDDLFIPEIHRISLGKPYFSKPGGSGYYYATATLCSCVTARSHYYITIMFRSVNV